MKTCICGEPLTTNEQLRRGYCTPDCQRHHTKPPVFTGSRKPNTALTVIAPRVNRRNGTDNRATNGE